jgi:hypothetical protein
MCEEPNGMMRAPSPLYLDPIQLVVQFALVREAEGGAQVHLWAPEGSKLVAKYGSAGRALAAVRDIIASELDFAVMVFGDGD